MSGPVTLKIVGLLMAFLNGCICFIIGYVSVAFKKTSPCAFTCVSDSSTFRVGIHIAFNKSVLPEADVTLLLPCLITGTPALANTKDTVVKILKLLDLSPPVPQAHILLG